MRTVLLFIPFIFILKLNGYGQPIKEISRSASNTIYLESYLMRHDFSEGFVSLNYERVLGKRKNFSFRIGIYPDFESTISFPLSFAKITHPESNHHLEYGIGAFYRIEHFVDPHGINNREWFFDWPAILIPIMYRYDSKNGLFLRMGINIFVSWPTLLSPSFSLGYRF